MPEENYEINLLRMIFAELYILLSMTGSREMYGKSYFSLGLSEKPAVDQAVWGLVSASYQAMTPELLKAQTAQQQVGFQTPSAEKKP